MWYPMPEAGGPGHSVMAYSAIQGRSDELRSVVETAKKAGVAQLVISSEAFSAAYPRKIGNIASILGDDVHLLVTLNSPLRRAVATWQELVKHGHVDDMESSFNSIVRRPEYRPDFLRRFVEGVQAKQISLIFSSANDPASRLISNVCEAIGLQETGEDNSIRVNRRYALIEAEILRAMNLQLALHAPGFPRNRYMVLRRLLLNTLQSQKWRETCPQIPIGTPTAFLPRLQDLAEKTLDEVRSLQKAWPIAIFGEPDCLLETPVE
jgi:hypothetical protein